jgi:hypothetical protein
MSPESPGIGVLAGYNLFDCGIEELESSTESPLLLTAFAERAISTFSSDTAYPGDENWIGACTRRPT